MLATRRPAWGCLPPTPPRHNARATLRRLAQAAALAFVLLAAGAPFLLLALPRSCPTLLLSPLEFVYMLWGCAVLPVSLPVDLLYRCSTCFPASVPHAEFVVFSRVVVLCLCVPADGGRGVVVVYVDCALSFVGVRGGVLLRRVYKLRRFCPHQ